MVWCSMFCKGAPATTTVPIDFETGEVLKALDTPSMGVLELDSCEECRKYALEHGMAGAYGQVTE